MMRIAGDDRAPHRLSRCQGMRLNKKIAWSEELNLEAHLPMCVDVLTIPGQGYSFAHGMK